MHSVSVKVPWQNVLYTEEEELQRNYGWELAGGYVACLRPAIFAPCSKRFGATVVRKLNMAFCLLHSNATDVELYQM